MLEQESKIDDRFTTLGPILGQGGEGEVFLVHDDHSGEKVALKVVRENSDLGDYIAEITDLASASHPNIATIIWTNEDALRVYQDGTSEQVAYIAMTFYTNHDMHDYLKSDELNGIDMEPLSEGICKFYLRQTATGLKYLHTHDISHGDINPNNILLDADYQARLTDFGKSEIGNLSTNSTTTRGFYAPEVSHNQVHDPMKADIFALAVTIHLMLYGPAFGMDEDDTLLDAVLQPNDKECLRENPEYRKCLRDGEDFEADNFEKIFARMIDPDPYKRPSIDDIFNDPWLSSGVAT